MERLGSLLQFTMPTLFSLRAARCCAISFIALCAVSNPSHAAPPVMILFVGNSFTYGNASVKGFQTHTVTDLNGTNIGGVPALFKAMTVQAGLQYAVSLETEPGAPLDFHHNTRFNTIVKPWDVVLLQSHSMLDAAVPGDSAKLIHYSGLLAKAFHARNRAVDVRLTATWSRADQTYQDGGAWYGKPIGRMALDLRRAYDAADAASPFIHGVIPVGEAWNRAIESGVADANPYDGQRTGKVNLWGSDNYHGSTYGYYLTALTIFGHVTGRDPRTLGASDAIAYKLGINRELASALQEVASAQLAQSR
jgi:hypothetical protein